MNGAGNVPQMVKLALVIDQCCDNGGCFGGPFQSASGVQRRLIAADVNAAMSAAECNAHAVGGWRHGAKPR